jgi:ADP-heptose:LPS heptosyltransferase
MAPGAHARALLGRRSTDVGAVLEWDSPEVARLLTGVAPRPGPLRSALETHGAAVAYSRSSELAQGLRTIVPRVLLHDPSPPPGEHASFWLARPAAELGGAATPASLPPVEPSAQEAAAARRWIARLSPRFVAVHPGSGSPSKNWPADRLGEVVASLAGSSRWLLVVGPADSEASAPLLGQRGAVVAAGLPPRVLGAVLSRAGLFIGNDSGVSHLAATFGAPTLALFGPTDPAVWSPVGASTSILRSPSRSMADLEPATVLERAAELLEAGGVAQRRTTSRAPGPPSS